MCGRVIQISPPIRYALFNGIDVRDSRVHNHPPRWNAAPSQELLVIRRNHDTGQVSLDPLRWGLIPYWCKEPKGGPQADQCQVRDRARSAEFGRRTASGGASCQSTASSSGGRSRQKAKQSYTIAMKDGAPFGLAGIWENWKEPGSGEWVRTFAIVSSSIRISRRASGPL